MGTPHQFRLIINPRNFGRFLCFSLHNLCTYYKSMLWAVARGYLLPINLKITTLKKNIILILYYEDSS
jgi:hypothetical protein